MSKTYHKKNSSEQRQQRKARAHYNFQRRQEQMRDAEKNNG